MAISKIELQVAIFRPWWQGGTTIDMDLKNRIPNVLPPGLATDGVVTTTGNYQVNIKHPNAPAAKHDVKFWATRSPSNQTGEEYQLLGIAFKNRDPAGDQVGAHVFTVTVKNENMIPGSPSVSTVTVKVNTRVLGTPVLERYEFKLLVQRIGDGELGIIDPEWENEN